MFHPIGTKCPSCNAAVNVVELGVNPQWVLGINWVCSKCGRKGGDEFELIDLVYVAQQNEGTVLQ